MLRLKYGLVGHPLGHSWSAKFFADKFAREKIFASYLNIDISSLAELPKEIERLAIAGFNVTIPYKRDILSMLDCISPQAEALGAVNVVKVTPIGWTGYNTDWIGFKDSLLPMLGDGGVRALVLGSGGAASAVCYALRNIGLDYISVSRTKYDDGYVTYDGLTNEIVGSHHLIVNATPLGMWPRIDVAPSIPYEAISYKHILYDLTYNPPVTKFMREALRRGATAVNGKRMLELQAEAAWQIWKTQ